MQPAIATGLMILALCPGGVSSNLVTFLAMGDVALSVTLTALSSLITVFTIPIFANLASQHFFGQGAVVELPIWTTIGQIFAITFLPIIIGMSIRQFVPKLSTKIEKITSISATVLLAVIILLLIIKEWSRLPNFIFQVGIGVLLLNTLSMAAELFIYQYLLLTVPNYFLFPRIDPTPTQKGTYITKVDIFS